MNRFPATASVESAAQSSSSSHSRSRSSEPVADLTRPLEAGRNAAALEALPLSFPQERLWFIDRLEPQSGLYNIPVALRLVGALDPIALRQALDQIVARHEALRTTFAIHDGVPVQKIGKPCAVDMPFFELSQRSAGGSQSELNAALLREATRPFDLTGDLMIRAALWQIEPREHVLLIVLHHIAADEWSLKILLSELAESYAAVLCGRPASLPELSIQYADFALWQREKPQHDLIEEQLRHWMQRLEGNVHPVELPLDRPRPAVQSHRGARVSLALPEHLAERLRALGREEKATLFMVLLACFKVLLHRHTRQEEIVIGTPSAGRNQYETERLIGFFVNTLVLKSHVSGDLSFTEFLERVRATVLDAFSHQDLPFERLVAAIQPHRSAGAMPLVQVMFAVEDLASESIEMPGLAVEMIPVDSITAKFDLTFVVQQSGARMIAVAEYATDLFERSTIERLLGHYQALLEGVATDRTQPIGTLPLLTAVERHQLVVEWNRTETNYPRDATLSELFERQVAEAPDAVALVFGDEQLTYAELNGRANYLADRLRNMGVGPDVLVGICAERSIQMVVGMLAVIKAGGAYLPLDPAYPSERLAYMISDARAPVILVQRNFAHLLPRLKCEVIELEAETHHRAANLPRINAADNLAYAIYTSGSTGRPKGVLVPHRAVVRLVINTDYVQLGPDDRVAHASNVCFDAATFEIWGALLNGARVMGVSREVALSPKDFAEQLKAQGITTLFLTTALFNELAFEVPEAFGGLKHLLFGGEKVDPKSVRRVLQHHPPRRLLHVYGPTESTTFTSWHEVRAISDDARTVPIGKPIANTRIYLLDPNMAPVPIGVPGELYVGGDGLARGYLNHPDLTAEKFVRDPFSANASARLYKTGDLARLERDGSIEFVGRLDHQVKVRGFRVELGEIEAVLKTHPWVRQSAIVAQADESGGSLRLVAYVVLDETASSEAKPELRRFLKEKLPEYMVPSIFMVLDALPLNSNGKVDRARLPRPDLKMATAFARQPPRNSVERELVAIWEKVLDLHPLGVNDDFFELGGHSLLAVRLFAEIEKKFDRKLPLSTLFHSPTIEQIAALLDERKVTAPLALLVGIQPAGSRPPIYWIHSLGGDGGGGFFYYRKLAELLGADQPSFGVRSPEDPLASIEDMAERYIAEIKSFQPDGPYFLGGFCFGGNVAYEIARQLRARGEDVRLLVLLESAVPRLRTDRARWRAENLHSFLVNLRFWCEELSHQSPSELLARWRRKQQQLRKKLGRAFGRRRGAAPLELADVIDMSGYPKDYAKYAQAHWNALVQYAPQPYAGAVTLFRARKQPLSCLDPTLGWGRLAEGGVTVNIVPGTHETMLEEPNVQILADELKACLAEAQVDQLAVGLSEMTLEPPRPESTREPRIPSGVIT